VADKTGNADKKKKKRIVTAKMICVTITLALAIYAITFGWFTESREAETNGIAGGTDGKGYRIITGAVSDYQSGVYDSRYTDENDSEIILNAKSATDEDGNNTKYVEFQDTDGISLSGYASDGDVIQWQMTKDSNLQNYTELSIYPGTQGYIDFYIQPTRTGDINVDFDIDLTAFCRISNDSAESHESDSEKFTATESQYYYRLSEGEDTYGVNSLIKGHILLFTEDENGNLQWLDPDSDGISTFTANLSTTSDDAVTTDDSGEISYKAVRKRIYWVWVKTWGQLTLDSAKLTLQDSGNIPISEVLNQLVTDSNDDCTVATDIVSSRLKTLFGEGGTSPYEYFFITSGSTFATVKDYMSKAINGEAGVYPTMKRAWNSADQQIGKNAGYITLELTANPHDGS
jgi:hypothetical protein